MSTRMRKRHDAAFKAIKEERTLAQLSSDYGVHANQIWQLKVIVMGSFEQ